MAAWALGLVALQPAATAQLLGPEFQVNSFTTYYQGGSAVAADGAGNFVVVWVSLSQDGSGDGVFGQRFDTAGNPVGIEFQVNTHTTNNQHGNQVAMDGAGDFVVVWSTYNQDGSGSGVFGRRYTASGAPAGGEFQVNAFTTFDQDSPAVAADGAGSFVVVWRSLFQDGPDFGIFGQRFDAAGARVGGEFQVNTYTTKNQAFPRVAADSVGNFVVVWESYDEYGTHRELFGQRFHSTGTPAGNEFQVNSYTTGEQFAPGLAANGFGEFVVTWSTWYQDGSWTGVSGQRFDATGAPAGGEFQVNSYTTGNQSHAAVAVDPAGGFVVTWSSYDQDGSGNGVFGQRFSPAGGPVGSEFQINSSTTRWQNLDAIAADGAGNFVVTWTGDDDGDSYGVFGQRLPTAIAGCAADGATLCLRDQRFQVQVSWTNYAGQTGFGQVVPFSDESGLFWFFTAQNLEFLVKVIDGCSFNSRYWVYAAATTDVEYTMTVTDTRRNVTKTYTNPIGTASPAITDSAAFATCP